MKTADEMFRELGYRKNTSICYSEERGVLLYEKPVKNQTDSFEVYFNGGQVVFWDTAGHAVWMDPELAEAINKKFKEMEAENEKV